MNDKSLYFELASIALLLALGCVLLLLALPGWGLIYSAVLLSALSFSLRKLFVQAPASEQTNNHSGRAA